MKNTHSAKNIFSSERVIDLLIATVLISVLIPIWFINALISIVRGDLIFSRRVMHDALDRMVPVALFNHGIFIKSSMLIAVIQGHLKFSGVSLHHSLDDKYHDEFLNLSPGIFSLFDMYQWIGLADKSHHESLLTQTRIKSGVGYWLCISKLFLTYIFYAGKNLKINKTLTLFGIKINNLTLNEALSWIFKNNDSENCQLGFFVNVNSINIAIHDSEFKSNLCSANRIFADGSGVRLAATHTGEKLLANLNGTDLLPHICRAAITKNKSIYLLGSEPGVARLAAQKLQNVYVGLKVAGYHHGYFSNCENEKIVNDINESGADICLVAMGSPLQENWLIQNAHKMNCSTALAVGGLLDFYSEKISRAPSSLRELGLEWVWRLAQEPMKKFNRYVVGNPAFLFRTYLMNQARGQ